MISRKWAGVATAVCGVLATVVTVAYSSAGGRSYLPMIKSATLDPRHGVALAYGWAANPDGARMLGVGTTTCWGLAHCTNEGTTLAQFWSECWPSVEDCQGDYFAALQTFAARGDYAGFVLVGERPLVKFLNEPDNRSQANDSPAAAAEMYLQVQQICPHCLFTFPGVGSWDYFCDWPEHERTKWHAVIDDGGQWCWSRAFLAELAARGEAAVFEVCSIHHYYQMHWHEPKRAVGAMEPADSLGELVGCNQFIIAEFGTCDPVLLGEMVAIYRADPRVLGWYVWTANLPPVPNWSTCEVLFDWETGDMTQLGAAYAEAGN